MAVHSISEYEYLMYLIISFEHQLSIDGLEWLPLLCGSINMMESL